MADSKTPAQKPEEGAGGAGDIDIAAMIRQEVAAAIRGGALTDAMKDAVKSLAEAGDLDGIIEDTTGVLNVGGANVPRHSDKLDEFGRPVGRIRDVVGEHHTRLQDVEDHFPELVLATHDALSGMGHHRLTALKRLYYPDPAPEPAAKA